MPWSLSTGKFPTCSNSSPNCDRRTSTPGRCHPRVLCSHSLIGSARRKQSMHWLRPHIARQHVPFRLFPCDPCPAVEESLKPTSLRIESNGVVFSLSRSGTVFASLVSPISTQLHDNASGSACRAYTGSWGRVGSRCTNGPWKGVSPPLALFLPPPASPPTPGQVPAAHPGFTASPTNGPPLSCPVTSVPGVTLHSASRIYGIAGHSLLPCQGAHVGHLRPS